MTACHSNWALLKASTIERAPQHRAQGTNAEKEGAREGTLDPLSISSFLFSFFLPHSLSSTLRGREYLWPLLLFFLVFLTFAALWPSCPFFQSLSPFLPLSHSLSGKWQWAGEEWGQKGGYGSAVCPDEGTHAARKIMGGREKVSKRRVTGTGRLTGRAVARLLWSQEAVGGSGARNVSGDICYSRGVCLSPITALQLAVLALALSACLSLSSRLTLSHCFTNATFSLSSSLSVYPAVPYIFQSPFSPSKRTHVYIAVSLYTELFCVFVNKLNWMLYRMQLEAFKTLFTPGIFISFGWSDHMWSICGHIVFTPGNNMRLKCVSCDHMLLRGRRESLWFHALINQHQYMTTCW